MAAVSTSMPRPVILNVSLEDVSMLRDVKKAISMLRGVTKVSVLRSKKYDITKTAGFREAMEDVRCGRVTHYDSLQDFYKEMGL